MGLENSAWPAENVGVGVEKSVGVAGVVGIDNAPDGTEFWAAQ